MLHGLALVVVTGDRSFYVDKPEWGDNYGKFIGEELVEITRSLLPLSRKKEDTFIGGISMGGFGALINGFITAILSVKLPCCRRPSESTRF